MLVLIAGSFTLQRSVGQELEPLIDYPPKFSERNMPWYAPAKLKQMLAGLFHDEIPDNRVVSENLLPPPALGQSPMAGSRENLIPLQQNPVGHVQLHPTVSAPRQQTIHTQPPVRLPVYGQPLQSNQPPVRNLPIPVQPELRLQGYEEPAVPEKKVLQPKKSPQPKKIVGEVPEPSKVQDKATEQKNEPETKPVAPALPIAPVINYSGGPKWRWYGYGTPGESVLSSPDAAKTVHLPSPVMSQPPQVETPVPSAPQPAPVVMNEVISLPIQLPNKCNDCPPAQPLPEVPVITVPMSPIPQEHRLGPVLIPPYYPTEERIVTLAPPVIVVSPEPPVVNMGPSPIAEPQAGQGHRMTSSRYGLVHHPVGDNNIQKPPETQSKTVPPVEQPRKPVFNPLSQPNEIPTPFQLIPNVGSTGQQPSATPRGKSTRYPRVPASGMQNDRKEAVVPMPPAKVFPTVPKVTRPVDQKPSKPSESDFMGLKMPEVQPVAATEVVKELPKLVEKPAETPALDTSYLSREISLCCGNDAIFVEANILAAKHLKLTLKVDSVESALAVRGRLTRSPAFHGWQIDFDLQAKEVAPQK